MAELTPMNAETLDLTNENIQRLKELFPEVLTENQIDFEKLRLILGDAVNDKPEKYSFNWNGKQNAIKLAQQPSTGTLRPNKEKSKNWDATENIYIEGDNLEVLKQLQKSYAGKVKVIYIDPPYNTGNDFVYNDNFKDSIQNYFEQTGQTDADGNILSSNTESNGRFHTDWLNMMYPRLMLAKNLLKKDGVIFISIDDSELSNIKKICDEIFGEHNFISNMIWTAGRKNDSKYISNSHEYVLVYVKDANELQENNIVWRKEKEGRKDIYKKTEELYSKYCEIDATLKLKEWFKNLPNNHPSKLHRHYSNIDHRGPYFKADISWPGGGGHDYDVSHPLTNKNVKKPTRGWLYAQEKMNELIKDNRVAFGEDESNVPTFKRYLKDTETQVPLSYFYNDNRGSMKRLRTLFDGKKIFDYPKDENVLLKLFSILKYQEHDIVLDFFAGSSTTAHAIMKLNVEDGLKRKFIMVQLPEQISKKEIAYKEGYNNISNISQERIRRAGEKVKMDNQLLEDELDIGFKVFELDNSNIKKWNVNSEDIEETLFTMENNFVEGRSHLDIVYEVLLKLGLDLNTPFEESMIDGASVYDVALGNVYVILGDNITQEVANYVANKQKKYENENPSVVFNDNGFTNDNEKLNTIEILKNSGFNNEQLLSI